MNELSNTEHSRSHKALLEFWPICVETQQSPSGHSKAVQQGRTYRSTQVNQTKDLVVALSCSRFVNVPFMTTVVPVSHNSGRGQPVASNWWRISLISNVIPIITVFPRFSSPCFWDPEVSSLMQQAEAELPRPPDLLKPSAPSSHHFSLKSVYVMLHLCLQCTTPSVNASALS